MSWCVRFFGRLSSRLVDQPHLTMRAGSIEWFAPMLVDIATAAQNSSIEVHTSVYVTLGNRARDIREEATDTQDSMRVMVSGCSKKLNKMLPSTRF